MTYLNKKVIIVGGSGFIGTELAKQLVVAGAHVTIVDLRESPVPGVISITTPIDELKSDERLHNPYVVFNLAGAPIFKRWNKKYKEIIKSSRIYTTRTLVELFKDPVFKPEFFVSTSAVGVYGDRGDALLDEDSEVVTNTYLAHVALEWELEALKATEHGVSVRIVRNGHVLGRGGILEVMKKKFGSGLGAILGSGKQYMSFVSLDRCVATYMKAPHHSFHVINAVSITPITNKVFSQHVGKVLHKPVFLRVPRIMLSLVYGEFAEEITSSQRVVTLHDNNTEELEKVIEKYL